MGDYGDASHTDGDPLGYRRVVGDGEVFHLLPDLFYMLKCFG